MKFTALAMAVLLGVTDAKKVTSRTIMNRAKEGKVNKQVLMRGASPYNDAAKRKLDDAEWEIDGTYSIEFDSCISLMTQNDDLFDDEDGTLAGLAESGVVKSETSYITFSVIGSSETMTFITDVATYFNACLLYTSPSPRDRQKSRMPSSA